MAKYSNKLSGKTAKVTPERKAGPARSTSAKTGTSTKQAGEVQTTGAKVPRKKADGPKRKASARNVGLNANQKAA